MQEKLVSKIDGQCEEYPITLKPQPYLGFGSAPRERRQVGDMQNITKWLSIGFIVAFIAAPSLAMNWEKCMKLYESERTCKSIATLDRSSPEAVSVFNDEDDRKVAACIARGASEQECRTSLFLMKEKQRSTMKQHQLIREKREQIAREKAWEERQRNWETDCGGVTTQADLEACFGTPDYRSVDDDGRSYYSYERDGVTKHFHMQNGYIHSKSESELYPDDR